jgi:WD40 repeat protein
MTTVIKPPGGSVQDAPVCPYMGLRSYTEADSDYFFARDSDRDLVVSNLMASRLTVLYGPSGVGKSSLLQAGVLPLLRRASEGAFSYLALDDAVVIYFDSWRDEPLAELGVALLAGAPKPEVVRDLMAEPRPLSIDLLQEVTARLGADVYLLLDQFEELALYQTGDKGKAIDVELGRIITASNLSVSVLLGVRDDALAKLDRLKAHVPGIFDKNLRLHHLSRSGAREAIEKPLAKYNASVASYRQVSIESELVDELLNQLQKGAVSVGDAGKGVVAGSESIGTPYLQLVMTRLWEAEDQQGSRVLRLETLRQLGGAEQIVSTHLDTVMAELTEEQRDTAAAVFRYLVTPSGMKIAYNADDLAYLAGADPSRAREVLEQLASGRERVLQPVPPPAGSEEPPRFEIFHDVMAPAVLDWRRRYVAERERVEVEDRHRATRRRLQRSRMVSAALAFLLIITGVLLWAVVSSAHEVQRSEVAAQRSKTEAQRSEVKAQQSALLARYSELLSTDPAQSLNAALEAWRIDNQNPEAETAVRLALDSNNELLRMKADARLAWTSEFSPDGKAIVTAGSDGVAKTFDAMNGRPLKTFQPSGSKELSELRGAAFSPDGRLLLTSSSTGDVRLFDAATAADLGLLTHAGPAVQALWGTRGDRPVVLVSDWNSPPALWDAESHKVIATYGTKNAGDAAFSPDGRLVVAADYDYNDSTNTSSSRISVWDARSGRLLKQSKVIGADADYPRFAGTDSRHIAVFVAKPDFSRWNLLFWDWNKGPTAIKQIDVESREPAFLEISKDGRSVAAPLDKRVRIFDADSFKKVAETPEAPDWVNDAVSFSADGRWLATSGADGRVRVWSAKGGNNRPVAELPGHGAVVSDVQFDPRDPWRLTTAGLDGTARIWQLPVHTVLAGGGGWMLGASISSDGRHLVTAEENGWVRVYNAVVDAVGNRSWTETKRTKIYWAGQLRGAAFTPDGRKIVAGGEWSFAPEVWSWQDSDSAYPLALGKNPLRSLPAVSEDGRYVAAGDREGELMVWEADSGKIVARVPVAGHDDVMDVRAVPHSDWFAVASWDGTVRLWDPDHPDEPRQTLGRAGDPPALAVNLTSDGAYLASVSEKHEIQVWGLSDGERVQVLEGPSSTNTNVTFSQDGSLLAVSAGDAAVHVWQWRDGHKLAVLHRHSDLVNTVQFMPDGNLLTASDDSTVAIFPCTTCGGFEELRADAQRRVEQVR